MIDFDEPQDFAKIINGIVPNLGVENVTKNFKMLDTWKCTVSSIESRLCNTVNMADHSHVVDLKNGILLVEVDHPGWIQLLQIHQKRILRLLREKLPEFRISAMSFRVKGSDAALAQNMKYLYPTEQDEKESVRRRIEEEDRILSKLDSEYRGKSENSDSNSSEKKDELPAELKKKLDELKRDMLTNSKN